MLYSSGGVSRIIQQVELCLAAQRMFESDDTLVSGLSVVYLADGCLAPVCTALGVEQSLVSTLAAVGSCQYRFESVCLCSGRLVAERLVKIGPQNTYPQALL
jgi:hypothetical protein